MAPTVILIRHAEAIHKHGLNTQCPALSKALQASPIGQEIGLIVVSPLQRTLQTATTSLDFLISRSIPVIARAEWQENTVNAIDMPSPLSTLTSQFPSVDFSQLEGDEWLKKEGVYAFEYEALLERGRVARKWLRERKESVVAVVGHDGFMRVGICGRKFGNADFRIFEFEAGDGDGLVEWEETEREGGGLGTCPKGVFGWLSNDFKYMPVKPSREVMRKALAEGWGSVREDDLTKAI